MAKLNVNDNYHMLFWHEAQSQIEQMEESLVALEASPSEQAHIDILFRMAHSLKGACATMAFLDMTTLTHEMESLFTRLKNKDIALCPSLLNLFFSCIDALKQMHHNLIVDHPTPTDISTVIEALMPFLSEKSSQTLPLESVISQTAGLTRVSIHFEPTAEFLNVKSYLILEAIKPFADVVDSRPLDPIDQEDDKVFNSRFTMALALKDAVPQSAIEDSLRNISEIAAIIFEPGTETVAVKETESTAVKETEAAAEDTVLQSIKTVQESIKIPLAKIETLINLITELALDKSTIIDIVKQLKSAHPQEPAVVRLISVTEHLNLLCSELQEVALSTRMLPLEVLFRKFPRMVREIANETGKSLTLSISGADYSVDRSILEALHDPITHLLRNAIDHGIETPDQRIELGKPAQGALTIQASQGHDYLRLTLADDGRGIDWHRIESKALLNGLVSLEEAQYFREDDWLNIIFKPGFSTHEKVTTLSGRGVGLDIVKANISRMNGQVNLQTSVGIGTTFILQLPLTLAILKVMLIEASPYQFALPLSHILEVLILTPDQIREQVHQTDFSQTLYWCETLIPLTSLQSVFNLPDNSVHQKRQKIMVVSTGERIFGLMVPEIVIQDEIVVKSLSNYIGEGKLLGDIVGVLGSSLLGDGSICYIIDTAAIASTI